MTERDRSSVLPVALAGVAGAGAVLLGVLAGTGLVAIALLVAAGVVLTVPVPWGGTVPIAVAAAVATIALIEPELAVSTLAVGFTFGSALLLAHAGPVALPGIDRLGAGIAAALALDLLVDLAVVGEVPVLGSTILSGAAMLVADIVVSHGVGGAHRIEVRSAVPVHLTLTCAGALVAVAVDEVGVAMAAVAAFPLLITRFSFQRYARAADTLQQTVQALGLVPELAGLAPLGHSERSAAYALALARELGLDRASATRVVTATRLHHLGAVPLEDGPEDAEDGPGEVAATGARVLREAGFPADVAKLLESARADAIDAPSGSLEAAIVRAAATFDEIVGEDAAAADRGLSIVSSAARDQHSRRAAAALLELVATRPTLVDDAVAAGDRFREAAVGLDLEAVGARRPAADLLPFARRG